MNLYNTICFYLFLCCLISISVCADERVEALKSVVMINTKNNAYGSGLVVGEDDSWIYIITAAHVVWDDEVTKAYDSTVEFKAFPGKKFPIVLATPINTAAPSATPVSLDLMADFAVLKVNKTDLPKIQMPELGRVFDNEPVNKVQFVGRKSLKDRWRGTPLFDVISSDELISVEDHQIVVNSFFQLSGYSGGGVFEENWRLAGMTIKGGVQSTSFAEDELTSVLHVSWVIEKLKSLSIPLAPYLTVKEGLLSHDMTTSNMPFVSISVLPNVPESNGGKLMISLHSSFGALKNIQYKIFIKNKKNTWSKLSEEVVDLSYSSFPKTKNWILTEDITNVFVCYSAPIRAGGRGVASVSLNNIKLPLPLNAYSNIGLSSPGYKQAPALYSIRSQPCDKILEAEGIDAK